MNYYKFFTDKIAPVSGGLIMLLIIVFGFFIPGTNQDPFSNENLYELFHPMKGTRLIGLILFFVFVILLTNIIKLKEDSPLNNFWVLIWLLLSSLLLIGL